MTTKFGRFEGTPDAVLEGDVIVQKEEAGRLAKDTREKLLAMLRAGK